MGFEWCKMKGGKSIFVRGIVYVKVLRLELKENYYGWSIESKGVNGI